MRKIKAMEMRRAALLSAQSATDSQALTMPSLYLDWVAGEAYGGDGEVLIVRRPTGLFRVRQAHTSQVGWEPENTPAMWKRIDVEHSGTLDDPIPYYGNMELFEGKHYIQDDVIYLCTRNTGNPVYDALTDLVGLYVEVATDGV